MSTRQVILDTETTGLRPDDGHRIIEIGCLEVLNRRPTERTFHVYLNPEREIDEAATAVHGYTWEMLKDKPKFADVARDFLEFVRGAEVVIHNAPFDVGFLNAELARLRAEGFEALCAGVVDTLALAKSLHPGKRNSLDALCDRYGIANSHRTLHGALLDARLLADVYLAMTRGQESFEISLGDHDALAQAGVALTGLTLSVLGPSAEELARHETYLDGLDKELKGLCVWRR